MSFNDFSHNTTWTILTANQVAIRFFKTAPTQSLYISVQRPGHHFKKSKQYKYRKCVQIYLQDLELESVLVNHVRCHQGWTGEMQPQKIRIVMLVPQYVGLQHIFGFMMHWR